MSLQWYRHSNAVMRSTDSLPILLVTKNIRYATGSPVKGEDYWEVRRPRIISELIFNTSHCPESFICLQEVLHGQLVDILAGLNASGKKWAYIGVGRDDGHQAGEYSPIIYEPSVWELKSCETIWLSETPDRPSKGWDAACIRLLTIGVFQHYETKKRLAAMCTHLDHMGTKSRLESAKIILAQVDKLKDDVNGVFLAGDFNSPPDTEAYKHMTGHGSPMYDLRSSVPEDQRYGHTLTFSGFQGKPLNRIDFLFLNHGCQTSSGKTGWTVNQYAVLENRFEDGVYNSDHRAVVGDVELQ